MMSEAYDVRSMMSEAMMSKAMMSSNNVSSNGVRRIVSEAIV